MVIDVIAVIQFVAVLSAPVLLILGVANFIVKLLEKARDDMRLKMDELRRERDDVRVERDDARRERNEMRADRDTERKRRIDCEDELYELRRQRRVQLGDTERPGGTNDD